MKPNGIAALAAALGCAISMAGCGGSAHGTASGGKSQVAVSGCMRAHGVPNFPDPGKGPHGSDGMTILFSPGSSAVTIQGIPFSGPAFNAAEKACGFLAGGGSGPPPIPESQKLAAIAFARCMRFHGVPNYPDPTFPAGGGIMGGSGPGINRNSPVVVPADVLCQPLG